MLAILLFSIPLAWFHSACGKLQANCSSGMTVMNDQNATAVINITGRLSNDSNIQRSCVLKLDKSGSFLRVKAKRNDNYKGEYIFSFSASLFNTGKLFCFLLLLMKIKNHSLLIHHLFIIYSPPLLCLGSKQH